MYGNQSGHEKDTEIGLENIKRLAAFNCLV